MCTQLQPLTRKRVFGSFLLVLLLSVLSASELMGTNFLPAGKDRFDSEAMIEIQGAMQPITLAGPTTIARSGEVRDTLIDPVTAEDIANGITEPGVYRMIVTEMEAACLEADDGSGVQIYIGQCFGLRPSMGRMIQTTEAKQDSADFPAVSTFDINFKIVMEGEGAFCSQETPPLRMSAKIDTVPPLNTLYDGDMAAIMMEDCCTGELVEIGLIHISHRPTQSPPTTTPPTVVERRRTILVSNTATSGGPVELCIVAFSNCDSIIFCSGEVQVDSGQSASTTALMLVDAILSNLAPFCDFDFEADGNAIQIAGRTGSDWQRCINGTSVEFAEVTANGQKFNPGTDEENVPVVPAPCSQKIPTLTEWGMIIFSVLLVGWMAWVIVRRRKRITVGY